jgi:hypothetical protein
VSSPPPRDRPPAVLAVAALVAAQGLGLVGLAVFYVVELVVASPGSVTRAVVAALLTLLGGLGLLAVARGLAGCRRWARAPALVTQLLVLPVAFGLVQGDRWYVGVPLILWALAVLVLLFTPAVAGVLEE